MTSAKRGENAKEKALNNVISLFWRKGRESSILSLSCLVNILYLFLEIRAPNKNIIADPSNYKPEIHV